VALAAVEALLYGLPYKVPSKINEGAKTPKLCPFPGRTATHLAPLFLKEEKNLRSKTKYQSLTIALQ